MRTALNHLEIAEHTTNAWSDNAYEFRPERKWHWLQRLCFRVLDKIGAHQLLTVTKRTYGPLNPNRSLEEALFNAVQNVMDFERFVEEDLYVIMGPKQARQYMSTQEFRHTVTWQTNVRVCRYGQIDRIYGVKCQVVPWIDGFAVVPYPQKAANVR